MQMVAFHRGPAAKYELYIKPRQERFLKNVPQKMPLPYPLELRANKQSMTLKFAHTTEDESFNVDVNITRETNFYHVYGFAWVASRARQLAISASWSLFNQLLSPNRFPVSTLGYTPIVDAPPPPTWPQCGLSLYVRRCQVC